MLEVTTSNYYDVKGYFSSSLFRNFLECEAKALAIYEDRWEIPTTTAMMVGSYIDAYFEGTLPQFSEEHPEIFLKDGKRLKADYRRAEVMITRAKRDKVFMDYMEGEKQVILTGVISNVPFKGKLDVFNGERIVDLKSTKSFERVWDPVNMGKVSFIDAWRYDIQAAIYRELVRQNHGVTLPFFINAITKEPEPDLGVFRLPAWKLDDALLEVETKAEHMQAIVEHKIEPIRCGQCDYCRATKVLTGPVDYTEYDWR